MRTDLTLVSAAVLLASVLAVAGGASAQYIPNPSTNDLGISENDVRDEPNHPDDKLTPRPGEEKVQGGSPASPILFLDGYTYQVAGLTTVDDLNNLRNVIMHGSNYDAYEYTMYPGQVGFEAYWGWWVDTGGGGDFQQSGSPTSGTALDGGPNGAIDDASDDEGPDCRTQTDPNWDEFVWRGPNNCADENGFSSYPNDEMYTFISPGTHNKHFNTMVFGCACPVQATQWNFSDAPQKPDFAMEYIEPTDSDPAGGELWRQSNGFPRYQFDQSLVMTTQVVTSVNPASANTDNLEGVTGTAFHPLQGASGQTHAHDIDIYRSLHPAAEELYRTAVWNPPQDYSDNDEEDNVFPLHEEGLKEWYKHDAEETMDNSGTIIDNQVSPFVEAVEPAAGFAQDLYSGPYKQEPNEPDDQYLDWKGRTLATYDGNTTYGGLQGDYYENPDAEIDYLEYKNGEHFWADAEIAYDGCPIYTDLPPNPVAPGLVCYGGSDPITPEVPATSDPADSLATEDDGDRTFGPSALYWEANAGTWFDRNGDTWVGNVTEQPEGTEDPYDGGLTEDPQNYASDEFRGSASVAWEVKIYPTEDTNGDKKADWGTPGVYHYSWADANPYEDVYMDVIGDVANPVLEPARNDENVGPVVRDYTHDDKNGRLSRHYDADDTGPITLKSITWDSNGAATSSGQYDNFGGILFPTGTADIGFKVVSKATLEDPSRKGQHGDTKDTKLTGSKVVDVDRFHPITESGD